MKRFVALTVALFSAPVLAEQHDRVAVVIGLDQPSAAIPALPDGEAQATVLATTLADSAGYGRVLTLFGEAVTAAEVLAVAKQGLDATTDNGSLLFVYVGRGAGGDYGEPAFLTKGASTEDPVATGLPIEQLASVLAPRSEAQSIVVVLDTAHDGAVDGVALIGPSADDWPSVPAWGLAVTSPNVRGRTAEAGRLIPALNDALNGRADENYDGAVTISELARFVGKVMSDGRGSLLNTSGSVDASLRMSDAGQQVPENKPVEQLAVSSETTPGPVALNPAAVVVGGVAVGAGIGSLAMYFNKRGECVEFEESLRCGDGAEYERYRATQHALGWSSIVLGATAVGLQIAVGPSTVSVSGRW